MDIAKVLRLPCVAQHELYDIPEDFDHLTEILEDVFDFVETEDDYECFFPVGAPILSSNDVIGAEENELVDGETLLAQTYGLVTCLSEDPVLFMVECDQCTDYGLVDGLVLNVYREFRS